MVFKFSDTYMLFISTKGIWDTVHQIYYKALDAAKVYEIKVKIEVSKFSNMIKDLCVAGA